MADQTAVFRAVADFGKVNRDARRTAKELEDVGGAAEKGSAKATAAFAAMEKSAKKSGQQTAENLTDPIKKDIDDLQRRLKTRKLELDADNDKAKAKIAEVQERIARTKGEIEITADDTELKKQLKEDQALLKKLRGEVQIDTSAGRREVAAMRAEITGRKMELQATINAEADTAAAEAQLDFAARDRKSTISLGMSGAAAAGSFLSQSTLSFGQLIALAGTLGTALIPVLGTITAIAAALAAPIAIAGGGATVAGIIMGVAASQTTEQLKAIAKQEEKVAGLEKGTKEYTEALKELRSMQKAVTPAQEKFADAQNNVKSAFDRLRAAAGPAIFRPMAQGMNILAKVLPKLAPLIRSVSGVMQTFLGDIGQFVSSNAFKDFIAGWADTAGPVLEQFGLIAKNMFLGLFGLFKAFAPLGFAVVAAIQQLSIAFREWGQSAGDKGSGVQAFIAYAVKMGPLVLDFFVNLVTAVGHLLVALAPLGTVVLTIANGLLSLFNAIPPDVITAIITGVLAAVAAFKALQIAVVVLTTAIGILNGTLAVNPFVAIAIGIAALVAGLILLYKRSETARKVMNAVWNGIKAGAKAMWSVVKVQFALFVKGIRLLGRIAMWLWQNAIRPAFQKIGQVAKWLWKNAVQPALSKIGPLLRLIGAAATWFWKRTMKAFRAVGRIVAWLWKNAFMPALRGIGALLRWLFDKIVKPVFDGIKWAIGKAWKGIKVYFLAWKMYIQKVLVPVIRWLWNNVVKPVFNAIGKAIGWAWNNVIKPAFNGLKKGFSAVGDLIKSVWNNVIKPPLQAFKDFLDTIVDAIETVLDKADDIKDIAGGVVGKGKDIVGGVAGALGFASGGYVTRPTRAIVGEGGEAEAILPKSVLTSLMAAAGRAGAAVAGAARKVIPTAGREKQAPKTSKGTEGAFKKTGSVVARTVKGQIVPALNQWDRAVEKRLAPTVTALEKKHATPAMNRIGRGMQRLVNRDLRNMGNAWTIQFRKKSPADYRAFRSNVQADTDRMGKAVANGTSRIRRLFANLASGLNNIWQQQIKPVFVAMGAFIGQSVVPVFKKGVQAVAAAWSKLGKAVAKPVKFVIVTVINGGLIAGVNKIAEFAGVDKMKPVEVPKFATGGHPRKRRHQGAGAVRGSGTPRQDNIPSMLSTKEHVWSAKEVAGAGGHGAMEQMRAAARSNNRRRATRPDGRPKDGYWIGGGVMPSPTATSISQHDVPYYGAWYAADMNGPYDGTSGAPVVAWKKGRVAYTNQSDSSYGYETVINHADGNFTRYAHQLPGSQRVASGDQVSQGMRIGSVGETGNAQGAHLHFEIKGGQESPVQGIGGNAAPVLPPWAQKISENPTKWAQGLLDGGKRLAASPWGQMIQGTLNKMTKPLASWASSNLNKGLGAAGNFGPGAAGVWKSLMSTGFYSPQQAAGVMGNMQSESGFNPHIVQGGGTAKLPIGIDSGWGLVQWTPGHKVLPYLNGDGSIGSQIGALTAQLQGRGSSPEGAAGAALRATKTPESAANVFGLQYERYAGPPQANRATQARAIYEKFKGTHDGGGVLGDDQLALNRSGKDEYVLTNPQYRTWAQMLGAAERGRIPGQVGQIGNLRRMGSGAVQVNNTKVIAPSYTWHVHNPIPEKTSATTLKSLTAVAQRGLNR